MTNWELLVKELKFFGVTLLNNRECRIYFDKNKPTTQGIIKTIRQLNASINKRKKLLSNLWEDICIVLDQKEGSHDLIDYGMEKLFLNSLKDLSKFLLCFSDCEKSSYKKAIDLSLSKDILMFSKDQISKLIDYKISVDWIHRVICKLLYIKSLLAYAVYGEKRVNSQKVKIATGVAGPWAHLDLPMEERVFPFGQELGEREKDKQKQRRYRKGLENYNNDGRCGEGHYWRELRNEPYSWSDRGTESPYPSRTSLMNWG